MTATGTATIQGKSNLGTHNNNLNVIATNLTSISTTAVGGQVGTSELLEITSSLTIQNTTMQVQTGTVSLTQASSVVAADDNTVYCPMLQANTVTFNEQNVTLTQQLNVTGAATVTTATVGTLTSQSLNVS